MKPKVRQIKNKIKQGEKIGKIARKFGVTSKTIRNIKNGSTWKNVKI